MTTMRSAALLLAIASSAMTSRIEAQTSTDIFLADLRISGDSIRITTPRNITNRPGYDNQPWFTRDGAALLYNADIDGQTEIFRYDLEFGTRTRLTHTADNEYSPSHTRGGEEMLVVRWPIDMSTGALWRYSKSGEPIAAHAASVERIGYYGIIDDDRIAAFVNDSVQTFKISDASTGEQRRILTGLAGSPPQLVPGADAVSFMMPADDDVVWIHRLDLATGEVAQIAPAVGESLSYVWLSDALLLMPSGNAVYAINPWTEAEWRAVARFDDPALASIVRIAVNAAADRVAFVAEQEPPEQDEPS